MRLTVIRGFPGSGKTTYAKKHFDCVHLENDMLWVVDGVYRFDRSRYEAQKSLLRQLVHCVLQLGVDVVVSSTFVTIADVDLYREIAENYNADFHVLRCVGTFDSTHDVPKSVMARMISQFEAYPGEEIVCS